MSKNLTAVMDELAKSSPDWIKLGLFILKVGANKEWRDVSPTFKSWLDTFSGKLNVSRASLFKYRAGVEIGLKLKGLSLSASEESIVDALSKTKSDIIETLAKIIPLVPGELARKLTDEVFEGTMTRSRIRELLRLYKISPASCERPLTMSSYHAILAMLTDASIDWLDDAEGVISHKLVPNVNINALDGKTVALDAVLIVKRTEPVATVEIHGLVFSRKFQIADIKTLQAHCDYLWTVTVDDVNDSSTQSETWGQLSIAGVSIHQQRRAQRLGNRTSVAITAHTLLGALV